MILNNRGQTLIEVVIASYIIIIVLVAILTIVTNSLVISVSSKINTQASFKAQEALEIAHNIRDSNSKSGATPWDKNIYDPAALKGDGWYMLKNYNATDGWVLEFKTKNQADVPALATETITTDSFQLLRTIKVARYDGTDPDNIGDDNKRQITVNVMWTDQGKQSKVENKTVIIDWRSESANAPIFGPTLSCFSSDTSSITLNYNSPNGNATLSRNSTTIANLNGSGNYNDTPLTPLTDYNYTLTDVLGYQAVVSCSTKTIPQLSTGWYYSVALSSNGKVWSWGDNSNGQLGDNTTINKSFPVRVKNDSGAGDLSNIVSVSAGGFHSLALAKDGKVWAWGYNGCGALGDNTVITRSLPAKVKDYSGTGELSDIIAISASGSFSMALSSDGKVWAWGCNSSGQVGDNTNVNKLLPVRVKGLGGVGELSGITVIVAGQDNGYAISSDNKVWAWGANGSGQIGDNTNIGKWSPVRVRNSGNTDDLIGIISMFSDSDHVLALSSDNKVWAWGENSNGQLGDSTTTNRRLPVRVRNSGNTGDLINIAAIAKDGWFFSSAVDSAGKVWAWGNNFSGKLGDNTITQRQLPVRVKDYLGTGELSGIIAISGDDHSIALDTGYQVWAWGYNAAGQLGDGTSTDKWLPIRVRNSTNTGDLNLW